MFKSSSSFLGISGFLEEQASNVKPDEAVIPITANKLNNFFIFLFFKLHFYYKTKFSY